MAEIKDKIVTVESLKYLMKKENPVGTGSLSLNRKNGTTIGYCSVSEGDSTTASGTCSHAEGYGTTASGTCSHAEGDSCIASNERAHAEGHYTTASGRYSHAEGCYTTSSGECQHVQGKYNINDEEGIYAHIVGNGTSSVPSNAHTLDWDGNTWFAGDIKADGKMILSSNQYGDELPEAGTVGRIFFKRLIEE